MSSLKIDINKYGRFDFLYMFVMVIYMAQATPETSRMIGSISDNPIPFLLPIVLTFILCRKHPISFNNRNLYIVLFLYFVWAVCSLIKYGIYTTQELSYHFFMVYAIIIAYIHNRIFGYKLLPIYEDIMVLLCKIAVGGWLIAVLLPFSASFFRMFPETGYGNSILYLFTWMDPLKGQVYSGILRNAGCSWEPGRFAIMVALAIFCNLCQNGVKFKKNKNIWWFLIALATTQSTTGFFSVLILYIIFVFKGFNLRSVLLLLFIVGPIIYGLMQLDFMAEKVITKVDEAQDLSRLDEMFSWNASQYEDGVYLGSLDRFDAMTFEWLNFMNDPILGYSRNAEHSYFRTYITNNFVLANGLVKIFGMYGVVLGGIFFSLLLFSSFKIAVQSNERRKYGLFVLFCLSAISYDILSVPVFTSFWFYGFFSSVLKTKYIIHPLK